MSEQLTADKNHMCREASHDGLINTHPHEPVSPPSFPTLPPPASSVDRVSEDGVGVARSSLLGRDTSPEGL